MADLFQLFLKYFFNPEKYSWPKMKYKCIYYFLGPGSKEKIDR